MNYAETLDYLYARLPMYSRVGAAAYKEDLGNIIELCAALEDPQKKLRCIHIAGTNGKGSTSHMLAAILQEAGYKTGLYTSPHIYDFRERIRIDGKMVDENFIVDFVASIQSVCSRIEPSFFEVTVAMAFAWFAKNEVDIAVIETGLGGRLDSTNIITPILSIITNIGLDHTDILGDTIEKIAIEKAGIIKKNIPVVIGETTPITKNIFTNIAQINNSACILSEDDWQVEYIESTGNLLICHVKDVHNNLVEKLSVGLTGTYQAMNVRTVLAAVSVLRKHFTLLEKAVHDGIANVKTLTGIYGRWEVVSNHPTVILDVSHNKEGFEQIMLQLHNNHPASDYHFIIGFVKDKDISQIFSLFPANSFFYFSQSHIPRALPHTALQAMAQSQNIHGESYDDVNDALKAAKSQASEKDVIIVCGSFFLVSEIRL